MTKSKSKRRMKVIGTNPLTGSPLKLPQYIKKATSAPSSPLQNKNNATSLQNLKQKVERKERKLFSGLIVGGSFISTPAPNRLESSDLCMEDAMSVSPLDDPPFREHMRDRKDDYGFNEDDLMTAHQMSWVSQLPRIDGTQRQRKRQAWTKCREDVLPTMYKFYLEAEAKIYQRRSLPTPPEPGASEMVYYRIPGCVKRKVSTLVECIERTGIHNRHIEHCDDVACPESLASHLVQSGCQETFPFWIYAGRW
ncbi:hypothetical protein M422DRAFT_263471 [Sphaerobolus stellatus SS14]|uniref:Uncharacterized protein n=1 Tax=Sphaerobolus stellatus (strain SS14) TaxID=990650 RepID=A0A0C9UZ00_SPHS4|nr:hypothetical protein M422DRAFT_263471 [Sphaerobolus stellatus SS14]